MFKRLPLIVVLLLSAVQISWADHVICRVLDAETHEPLEQAVVKCCHETDQLMHTVYTTTDSLGYIRHASYTNNQGNVWSTTISISYVGYHSEEINFVQGDNPKDTLRLADVLLRPSTVMLREATVKAQQKLFTMRGDTVVFHPGAFHLEEGERLTELIKQLPGVSVDKSGALTWNGRPIRLRMNGEEGMSESLLGQLPISAVKDIKAYEKLTELSERTGKDDGNGEQVLDITIKPGFLDKWYGQIEAKGYTTGNYSGEVDAHYLSKDRPIMVTASASDGNELRGTSGAGYRSYLSSDSDFYKQQYGGLSYSPKWTPDFEGWKERNYITLNTTPTHYDHTAESETSTTTFIEGAPSTHTDSRTTHDDHTIELPLYANTHLNLSPKTTLWLTVGGRYELSEKRTDTESETTDVNTATTHQSVHDESGSGMARAILTHYVKDGSLKGEVQANYSQGTSISSYQSDYHYFATDKRERDVLTFSTPHRNLSTSLNLGYEQWLGEHFELTTGYNFSYSNNTRNEEVHRNGEYDAANSFSSHRQLTDNKLNLGLTYSIGKWMFKPALNLTMQHERMAYQRGVLDTVAVRNVVMPMPSFSVRFKTSKFSFLQIKADYYSSQPDLISTLAYTDDTNVLLVHEGNPNLHASHTLNASANYSVSIPRSQQMFSVKMEYKKDFDAIGSVSTYNPMTGAYRTHDENMRGGSSLYFNVQHNCVLFKHLRWHHGITFKSNDTYGVLTLVEGSAARSLSRQRANSAHYGSTWTFDLQPVKITLEGAAGYTADRYRPTPYPSLEERGEVTPPINGLSEEVVSTPLPLGEGQGVGLDLWNYDLSLNAEYKWRAFTFSLLPSFAGHKGYNSARMNRDRFILGADVMWKFLKGRASLDLRANDIFNNADVVWSSESATQITESWTKSLHHYLLLTFRLHFDAKAAKK